MVISLSKNEYQYLVNADFFDREILDFLSDFDKKEGVAKVDLQDELIDYLREKLEDRLQVVGFDDNYDLTKKVLSLKT